MEETRIAWKCTIIRMLWIMAMALITVAGIIAIQEYGQPITGIVLIFLGVGTFIYKMKTWKRYEDEGENESRTA